MNTEQWQRIETLFHRALGMPADSQMSFLKRECGPDEALFREVISLLQAHRQTARSLLDSTAIDLIIAHTNALDQLDSGSSADASPSARDAGSTAREAPIANRETDDSADVSNDEPWSDQIDVMPSEQLRELVTALGQKFRIREVIGRGGSGIVLRATDRTLGREVAIKAMTQFGADPANHGSIQLESSRAAQIDSEHVVTVYSCEIEGGIPFLVMEYVTGTPLDRLINKYGRIPEKLAARLVLQAARGLKAAHAIGIIHGDVKSANIMASEWGAIDPDEIRVKVIDFGLSRMRQTRGPQASPIGGTPAFMSPEQLTDPTGIDERSDIYGLGATLYHCLTGTPPHGELVERITQPSNRLQVTPPRVFDHRISPDIESICMKALAHDRSRRYGTTAEFIEDLERYLAGHPVLARPVSRTSRVLRWVRRNPMTAAALVAATILLLAIAIVSSTFAWTVSQKNALIESSLERNRQQQIQRIIGSDPSVLGSIFPELDSSDKSIVQQLDEALRQTADDPTRSFNIACALTRLGEPRAEQVLESLKSLSPTPDRCQVAVEALRRAPNDVINLFQSEFQESDDPAWRAELAILALQLGHLSLAETMVRPAKDPTSLTQLIHSFRHWHADVATLPQTLELATDDLRYAVIVGVGRIPRDTVPMQQAGNFEDWVRDAFRSAPSAAVHGAAAWFMKRWSVDAHGSETNLAADNGEERRWQPFEPDITMVHIARGTFQMGRLDPAGGYGMRDPHQVTLTRDFWLADREVTVGLFQQFLDDPDWPSDAKPDEWETWQPDLRVSTSDQHPAQRTNWNDAVLFCNWLSHRHGLSPCYTWHDKDESGSDESAGDPEGYWECDFAADGFRLPTEAEWEYACRAGTVTLYSFGNDQTLLSDYARHSNNRIIPALPSGSLIPNRHGLFDMHGNVWEWTWDWMLAFTTEPQTDPRAPGPPPKPDATKIFRGGGVATYSGDPLSESRGGAQPTARFLNLGFRVARGAQ